MVVLVAKHELLREERDFVEVDRVVELTHHFDVVVRVEFVDIFVVGVEDEVEIDE